MWIYTPHFHSFELNVSLRLGDAPVSHSVCVWGGLLLLPVCSVVASCSFQSWPSIRDLWSLGSQPLPLRILSRQFALHELAFVLHFLPMTDCPCTAQWGFLLLRTNDMSHTALGCQQNYWRQISGHQRGCRKSIICQHLTCVFRVVKHCAQTDNCPLLVTKGAQS